MSKRVTIRTKPGVERMAKERWVQGAATAPRLKRLTLDIPEDLHRRLKIACARRGTKMAEELRALLEAHYPPEP